MSDPVTNVEIEDVLSSIRRLVSDGDKARTRDPAPVEAEAQEVPEAPAQVPETAESKPDKFVLTPAFMVVENEAGASAQTDEDQSDDEDAGWVEEIAKDESAVEPADEDQDAPEAEDAEPEEPLELKDMVWGSVEDARQVGLAAVPLGDESSEAAETADPATPSRSDLVATIAELEAAVSGDGGDFEPDGSEVASDDLNSTIAWPGSAAREPAVVEDAEVAEADPQSAQEDSSADEPSVSFEHRAPDHIAGAAQATPDATEDAFDDDDLDGLLEAGGVSLDEEALRVMVAEVVREELSGPLGERITRNVRKLVRREIYRILSSQEFD